MILSRREGALEHESLRSGYALTQISKVVVDVAIGLVRSK